MAEGVAETLGAVREGSISSGDDEQVFLDRYRRFVADHSLEFSKALDYAGDDCYHSLLFHCTSGKDRTGFAVAALLLALGTPRESILEDYRLTNSYMRDISHLFKASTPPDLIPTPLETGMRNWLETFAAPFASGFDSAQRASFLDDWTADYVRLRFAATKPR